MDEKLAKAEDSLIEALGRQSAFWGLGKMAGEMYAVLYLSPGPLSLEEVAARLSVTKGNISVAIRQLEQLGMVRRSWKRGDRRVFFEAEADFWKIAHSVLSLRHKPEFDQSFGLVDEGARFAKEAEQSSQKDIVLDRLESLQQFYRMLDELVESVLALTPDQMRAMAEMARVLNFRADSLLKTLE